MFTQKLPFVFKFSVDTGVLPMLFYQVVTGSSWQPSGCCIVRHHALKDHRRTMRLQFIRIVCDKTFTASFACGNGLFYLLFYCTEEKFQEVLL